MIAIGIGCRKGARKEAILSIVAEALARADLTVESAQSSSPLMARRKKWGSPPLPPHSRCRSCFYHLIPYVLSAIRSPRPRMRPIKLWAFHLSPKPLHSQAAARARIFCCRASAAMG